MVNVLWLSDLILGYMDALKLPIHSKYLQVGHGDEFVMDMNKVHHLMCKIRFLDKNNNSEIIADNLPY